MIELTNKQMKIIRKLVKEECANYIQAECIMLNGKCPQLSDKCNLCSYFKKSVLPLDEYLYSEVTREGFNKRCENCNVLFTSNAKNTRFCSKCAKEQRKLSYRNSKRRLRASMSTK